MKFGLQIGTSVDQHLWNSLYPILALGRVSWHSFDDPLFVVNSFNGFGGFLLFLKDPPSEAPQVLRGDMGMKVEQVLHMVGGAGETSYALNYEFQVGSSSTVCMNFKCIAYLITGLQLRYRRNHLYHDEADAGGCNTRGLRGAAP